MFKTFLLSLNIKTKDFVQYINLNLLSFSFLKWVVKIKTLYLQALSPEICQAQQNLGKFFFKCNKISNSKLFGHHPDTFKTASRNFPDTIQTLSSQSSRQLPNTHQPIFQTPSRFGVGSQNKPVNIVTGRIKSSILLQTTEVEQGIQV